MSGGAAARRKGITLDGKYVVDEAGCWLWTGALMPQGYGSIGVPGTRTTTLAHRASYEVHRGEIPPGMFVCHTCDVRRCINPDHLWLGTQADTMADMVAKGRANPVRGEANANCKLTWDEVQEIRRLSALGAPDADLAHQFAITKQYVGQLRTLKWRRNA
jgi:hypothetical protein